MQRWPDSKWSDSKWSDNVQRIYRTIFLFYRNSAFSKITSSIGEHFIFAYNFDFRQKNNLCLGNPKFFGRNGNFGQKTKFRSTTENLVKNLIFCEKSKFWLKMKILIKS